MASWFRDPRLILFAAWVFAIVYAYPGYMNFDAAEQLHQARIGTRFDDWHPPLMAAYWRILEMFVRGPSTMLVLQTGVFAWGLYAVLRIRYEPRVASIVAACLMVFPPILTPMAVVWKDAQMAAFLLGGTLLALRTLTYQRVLGCVLLLLAVGVRDNAAAALPPLLVFATSTWFERRRHAWLAAAGLFVVIVLGAMGANRAIRDVPAYPWYLSTAIHDIAGTICNAGPMDDAAVREATAGITLVPTTNLQSAICVAYKPRVWFELAYGPSRVFDPDPPEPERSTRGTVWKRVVGEYPLAYLRHRWAVTKEVLSISNEPWEPVCQTFAATKEQLQRLKHDHSKSWIQRRLGTAFLAISKTVLYRPWLYFFLLVVAGGYAIAKRNRLVLVLALSGLMYEGSLFLFASAPDFRYSHWMITCCCLALALIFGDRFRAGSQGRKAAGLGEREPLRE